MSTINVSVWNVQLPPFPVGPAWEVYKLLMDNYGAGFLIGPNGVSILNNSSQVPAGDYIHNVSAPEVVHGEGAPPSKRPRHETLYDKLFATNTYYEELLKPPVKHPLTVEELKHFLSERPVKLPILSTATYELVGQSQLVKVDTSEVVLHLGVFTESVFQMMKGRRPTNEASSSHQLAYLTGNFMDFLNQHATYSSFIPGLDWRLDSADPTTSKSASQPLQGRLRPDFELFVKDCLILRWENKIDRTDLTKAVHENTEKLKAWNPLFYDKLPYVIGGCCAGSFDG